MTMGNLQLPTGNVNGVRHTQLAFDGGYRVRCEKLPKNSLLKIVLAIGRPTGKEGLKIDISDGTHYWARTDIDKVTSLDDYFEKDNVPNVVKMDGEYIAARKMRYVKLTIVPEDALLKQMEMLKKKYR